MRPHRLLTFAILGIQEARHVCVRAYACACVRACVCVCVLVSLCVSQCGKNTCFFGMSSLVKH